MIEQSGKSRKSPSFGKMVETAQRQVEQRDYKSRKRVLDFDDVMNLQREIVYGYRNNVLTTEDPSGLVHDIIREIIPARTRYHLSDCEPYNPDHSQLLHWIHSTLPISASAAELADLDGDAIAKLLVERVRDVYQTRTGSLPRELLDQEQRRMVLAAIDRQWQQHLYAMDELREGVYLRSQSQKDPLVEYKNEAYDFFVTLMDDVKQEALQNQLRSAAGIEAFLTQLHRQTSSSIPLKLNLHDRQPDQSTKTPGRNSSCTCGSGRKFKHCCGRMT